VFLSKWKSGKLPVTFYKNINQVPDFEDYAIDATDNKKYVPENTNYCMATVPTIRI
jgi:hypothetical protein